MALTKTNYRFGSKLDIDFNSDGDVVGMAIDVSYDIVDGTTVVARPSISLAVWDNLTTPDRAAVNNLVAKIKVMMGGV